MWVCQGKATLPQVAGAGIVLALFEQVDSSQCRLYSHCNNKP